MASEEGKGNGKVHLEDSASQEALLTYKRRRLPEPEPGNVPEQVSDAFWKSRDIGWEHGIMIDENRQHWRCMYCGLTRYGGGVSRLKRHLAGDLDVKRCPRVPKHVSEKIRDHLKKKRSRRKKPAARNGAGGMKMGSSPDDTMAENDHLPVDLEKPAGTATQVFEEATNRQNIDHQECTVPEVPIEGPISLPKARDIGWEHAVNVDGNKRRWECKWCGLSRSGGVTTLKAHLTDNSCPKIPKDASKKILDYIEEKRAARHYLNTNTGSSPGDFKLDKDQVLDLQMQVGSSTEDFEEGTVQFKSDHEPLSNAMHKQTSKKGAIIEGEAGSNQWSAESSKQPVEHTKQSKESGGQLEEHKAMERSSLLLKSGVNLMANSEHQAANRNIKKSRILEVMKNPWKTRFNTRNHVVMIDENARHWRCRYCSLDGYGKTSRLKYHLAGIVHHPRCPNVPTEISEKARNQIMMRRRLKMHRAEARIHTNRTKTRSSDDAKLGKDSAFADLETQAGRSTQLFGETSGQLKIDNQLSSNPTQLSIKNAFSEVSPDYPIRRRDGAWEHSQIHDREKGHWQCKWCGTEGYHGVTRLKWHLVGWHNRRQCTEIPEDAAKTIRDQMKSREAQKMKRSSPLDSTNSTDIPCSSKSSQFDLYHIHDDKEMQAGSSTQAFDQANKKLKICNPLSSSTGLQTQKSTYPEPIREEPHDSRSSENTNRPDENAGTNGRWSHWKSVLEGLLQLPGLQEGAGIQSCIRDALLYGPIGVRMMNGMANHHKNTAKSQTSSVNSSEVKMDSERIGYTKTAASNVVIHDSQEDSNINTAKCQNVLVDILRSENFALLCNILWRAVHQDEKRSRYFDFSEIDSKMKNGGYEQSPELFNQDMQLVWKDLKKIGQEIIYLASNLSGITEAFYTKQVEGVEGLGGGEQKPEVTAVVGAEQKNLIESNAMIPSTSQDLIHSAQPDKIGASDVQKVSTCKQCATEAKGASILMCHGCKAVYHQSCVEPPMQSVSTGSWYCKSCSITCRESAEGAIVLAHDQQSCLHETCVVCDRLEVCKPPEREETVCEGRLVDASTVAMSSVELTEFPQLSKTAILRSCKLCGTSEEDDKRFLICGHIHCPYKYYHIRCLKTQQIASMAQRNKPCWFCPSCLCRVCLSDKDDDQIILCDGCDEAYHLYCMTPRRTSVPKGRWYCASCNVERAKEGMRQYERGILKLHRKNDARLQNRTYEAVDLLLCAAEKLRSEEQSAAPTKE